MCLGNCPPTPPQTYHFAQSEKEVLMLGLGRGRWAVSQQHAWINRNTQVWHKSVA